ncbi:YidC/Oxa1 family membrane protein insertase [Microbacterium sp. BR1]|uniref:YidC/Oxa1 family membrane protein insertase n=1 Tax=Microbacterium sp. BR1 TaxID=1070896 RepID=UPI000C2BE18F|nr:membrane protein insertase YidC [Microbacterium sp. BR1]
MDLFALPPLAAILDAVYAAMMWLTDLLSPIAGDASAAAAIVLVTLLVRAALIPVGISQARAEQTRARLAPRLREIQKRYKNDRERQQREMMRLYADENSSLFAGYLPMLAQAPVVGVIYALFLHTSIAGHANALLTEQLAGVPLGTSVLGSLGAPDPATWVVFGVLVLIVCAVAEVTRRAFRPIAAAGAGAGAGADTDVSPLTSAGARRVMGLLQYATAVVLLFVPLAAALYLTVTVTWTLAQRLILRRRYPLPPEVRRA